MKQYNVGIASDYATVSAGRYSFYFGYEYTVCVDHGKDAHCECGREEWAFVAWEGGKEVGRIPASELDDNRGDMGEILLRGVSRFGNKFWV